MNRLLVILLAASFALTAVAAISDHAVGGSGARPAAARQGEASPAPATQTRVPGIGQRRGERFPGLWAGNHRGGRKHPPTGR